MQLVRPAQEDGSMAEFHAYVGLDVHKDSVSVAIAEAGRDGEVRHWGVIRNTPEAVAKLARRLVERHRAVEFAYEAGPCGYTLYRHLTASGLTCRVVAPSRTPRKPGDRIKNDTRDAVTLARLLRAGELTFVWVPDEVHEAMRDLVRARQTAANDVRQARAHIQMFLLKHGIRYLGKPWGFRHRVWLADRRFPHAAQQLALQSYANRLDQAESRKRQLEEQLAELVPAWSLAPVVTALQALKGIQLVIAATLVAEVGDFSRFASPRQLMAFLGLVPSEFSSGRRVRPGGITIGLRPIPRRDVGAADRAGNVAARSLLFEAAWSYRLPAKVGQAMWLKQRGVAQAWRDISWKAQVRLSGRYRKLVGRGKKSNVAVTAVARELLGFVWAIATSSMPAPPKASPT
jgi:transposase